MARRSNQQAISSDSSSHPADGNMVRTDTESVQLISRPGTWIMLSLSTMTPHVLNSTLVIAQLTDHFDKCTGLFWLADIEGLSRSVGRVGDCPCPVTAVKNVGTSQTIRCDASPDGVHVF